MPAALTGLVTLRSQLAEEIEGYCARLIDKLDRTPWYRRGRLIRAGEVAVSVRVLKQSARLESVRERERDASREYVDPEIAALYEEATLPKSYEEAPWEQECPQVNRAMVLGGPGGGKSFLTQTTGLVLAQAAVDTVRGQRGMLDDVVLPVHLTLASLAGPDLPPDPAAAVIELLRREFKPAAGFLRWIELRLRTAATWLLLDGLDEVPEDRRPALTARFGAIDGQGWQTRLLLTCRPANWERGLIPWMELTEYELAPLNPQEIRQLVGRWYAVDPGRGETLMHALEHNYPLAHAARTPLITTFLCLAHEETPVTAATRRASLYAQVVRGLARRAWKAKPLARTDPHVDDLVRFLVRMARPLFERHPAGNLFTHEEIAAELERSAHLPIPWTVLEAQRAGRPMPGPETWPTLLRDELLECGILVGAGLRDGVETQFSFAHRTLLEYLVARNLSDGASPEALVGCVGTGGRAWWEVGMLAGSWQASKRDDSVWRLLEALCPAECYAKAQKEATDVELRMAWLAGEIVLENSLTLNAGGGSGGDEVHPADAAGIVDRIRAWLAASLEGGRLPVKDRAAAGVVLGKLGDPRKGVGLDKDGLPDVDWVPIEPGTFKMGEKDSWEGGLEFECGGLKDRPYRMSRYPVTVAQFEAFVRAEDGYRNPRWWQGLAWQPEPDSTAFEYRDYPEVFQTLNHPVVGVNWYETIAFCRWLSLRLKELPTGHPKRLTPGEEIKLASEAEYERGARGRQGRLYAWGNEATNLGERCNCEESGLGATCAVGMFPGGQSEEGVRDLTGNVWEWTRSLWGKDWNDATFGYPYHPDDGREDYQAPADVFRVFRGGPWISLGPDDLRAASRNPSLPDDRNYYIGFRCVVVGSGPAAG